MRKVTISGENVEFRSQSYGTYINGQDLDKILYRELVENQKVQTDKPFRAMITIVIEEMDENLVIKNETVHPIDFEEELPF